MKIENAIGWCDETTNAVTGCDKVSPGCKNCYAQVGTRARVLRSQGIETWGPNGVRHPVAQFATKIRALNKKCVCDQCHEAAPFSECGKTHEGCPQMAPISADSGKETFLRASVKSAEAGVFRRVRLFADSNSDWLDDRWPIEVFANFLNEIRLAPNVDVLLLTKRPENWEQRLRDAATEWVTSHNCSDAAGLVDWIDGWLGASPESAREARAYAPVAGAVPGNIWLGVSVENQAMADLRIPQLLKIPAAVRFLSCEPLLEPVDVENFVLPTVKDVQAIYAGRDPDYSEARRWVIVGGESGKNRRDCGVQAIMNVAEQCKHAGIACYVKQDCAFKSGEQGRIPAEVWGLKQFPTGKVLRELH